MMIMMMKKRGRYILVLHICAIYLYTAGYLLICVLFTIFYYAGRLFVDGSSSGDVVQVHMI